jgi:Coenzyme PQQ synthesis protein D (PqqD)
MISLQQKVTISPEVLSQEVDGETVILDLKSENYFGLDEVGTRIWQLLNDGSNLQAVFDTLLTEYDVDEKQLGKDLQDHMVLLVEAGLISLE